MKRLRSLLWVFLGVVGFPTWAQAQELEVLTQTQIFPGNDGTSSETLERPLPDLIKAYQQRTHKKTFNKRMVLHKSKRRLDLYADDEILKSYVVNLGGAPEGDKHIEGDQKTPEGDLYICAKNRSSHFTRYLGIAYPTPDWAREAAKEGKVSEKVVRDTEAAFRKRDRCPPQTSPLGGVVGIHGKGGWEKRGDDIVGVDWTLGCVGLRDPDILEIFNTYAEVGISLHIQAD
jgi:hypothetical protein